MKSLQKQNEEKSRHVQDRRLVVLDKMSSRQ